MKSASEEGVKKLVMLMDLMVSAGADPNHINSAGYTALSYLAAKGAPTEIMSHLIELQKSAMTERSSTEEQLSPGRFLDEQALYFAINSLHPSLPNVELLIRSGSPVNAEESPVKWLCTQRYA
jgi:ankyrin repeat protein